MAQKSLDSFILHPLEYPVLWFLVLDASKAQLGLCCGDGTQNHTDLGWQGHDFTFLSPYAYLREETVDLIFF